MTKNFKLLTIFVLSLATSILLVACGGGGGSSSGTTRQSFIRIFNAVPNSNSIELAVDGLPEGGQASFLAKTSYLAIEAGSHIVDARTVGSPQALTETTSQFDYAIPYTFYATGNNAAVNNLLLADDRSPPPQGLFRARLVNLIADKTLDFYLVGTGSVVTPAPTANSTATAIPHVTATAISTATVSSLPTVAASPTSTSIPTATPTFIPTASAVQMMNFVSQNGLLASAVAPLKASAYSLLPAGEYTLIIRQAGTGTTVVQFTQGSFGAGGATSFVIANGLDGNPVISLVSDLG